MEPASHNGRTGKKQGLARRAKSHNLSSSLNSLDTLGQTDSDHDPSSPHYHHHHHPTTIPSHPSQQSSPLRPLGRQGSPAVTLLPNKMNVSELSGQQQQQQHHHYHQQEGNDAPEDSISISLNTASTGVEHVPKTCADPDFVKRNHAKSGVAVSHSYPAAGKRQSVCSSGSGEDARQLERQAMTSGGSVKAGKTGRNESESEFESKQPRRPPRVANRNSVCGGEKLKGGRTTSTEDLKEQQPTTRALTKTTADKSLKPAKESLKKSSPLLPRRTKLLPPEVKRSSSMTLLSQAFNQIHNVCVFPAQPTSLLQKDRDEEEQACVIKNIQQQQQQCPSSSEPHLDLVPPEVNGSVPLAPATALASIPSTSNSTSTKTTTTSTTNTSTTSKVTPLTPLTATTSSRTDQIHTHSPKLVRRTAFRETVHERTRNKSRNRNTATNSATITNTYGEREESVRDRKSRKTANSATITTSDGERESSINDITASRETEQDRNGAKTRNTTNTASTTSTYRQNRESLKDRKPQTKNTTNTASITTTYRERRECKKGGKCHDPETPLDVCASGGPSASVVFTLGPNNNSSSNSNSDNSDDNNSNNSNNNNSNDERVNSPDVCASQFDALCVCETPNRYSDLDLNGLQNTDGSNVNTTTTTNTTSNSLHPRPPLPQYQCKPSTCNNTNARNNNSQPPPLPLQQPLLLPKTTTTTYGTYEKMEEIEEKKKEKEKASKCVCGSSSSSKSGSSTRVVRERRHTRHKKIHDRATTTYNEERKGRRQRGDDEEGREDERGQTEGRKKNDSREEWSKSRSGHGSSINSISSSISNSGSSSVCSRTCKNDISNSSNAISEGRKERETRRGKDTREEELVEREGMNSEELKMMVNEKKGKWKGKDGEKDSARNGEELMMMVNEREKEKGKDGERDARRNGEGVMKMVNGSLLAPKTCVIGDDDGGCKPSIKHASSAPYNLMMCDGDGDSGDGGDSGGGGGECDCVCYCHDSSHTSTQQSLDHSRLNRSPSWSGYNLHSKGTSNIHHSVTEDQLAMMPLPGCRSASLDELSNIGPSYGLPVISPLDAKKKNYLFGGLNSLLGASELERYFPGRCISLFIATWNMNGKEPPLNLEAFLLPDELEQMPDMFVLGTQESGGSRSEWEVRVQTTIGPSHVLFTSAIFGVLHLTVFVRRDLVWFCSVPEESTYSLRPGIAYKTKGGVAIGFQFFGTKMLFINSHLTAHEEKQTYRIQNFKSISHSLDIPRLLPLKFKHKDVTHRYDCVFWLGDLNFRLAVNRDHVFERLSRPHPEAYQHLLQWDQLSQAKQRGEAFSEFEEGDIQFPPTFKYDPGTDNYDSSSKQRVPSYTDRILFKVSNTSKDLYSHH